MAGVDKDFLGEARPRRRHHDRLSAAGAAARPDQGRARQRRGGRRRRPARCSTASTSSSAKLGEPISTPTRWRSCWTSRATLQDEIDAANAWDLDRTLEIAMDALRLPPRRRRRRRSSPAASGAASPCARLLLQQPDLLLLDEPTNHLDAESVAWLERHLARVPGHRRRRHARPLLPRQRRRAGSWSSTAARASRGRATTRPGWSRSSSGWQARRSRSRPASGRWRASWSGSGCRRGPAQAKSKARLDRLREAARRRRRREARRDVEIQHPARAAPRRPWSSRPKGCRKGYGDHLLIEDLTFDLPPRRHRRRHRPQRRRQDDAVPHDRRPGEAGRRHAARSATTVRAGLRRPEPRRARRRQDRLRGDHRRADRAPDARQAQGRRARLRRPVQLQGRRPAEARSATCSGGERNRVHLAKLLRSGGNLLLLDEPTNDLDVDTLRALEDALLNFAGCAVVISHDRWFLDRIATHILAFEGDSKVVWCEGNYQDYEARPAASASAPTPTSRTASATSRSSGTNPAADPPSRRRRPRRCAAPCAGRSAGRGCPRRSTRSFGRGATRKGARRIRCRTPARRRRGRASAGPATRSARDPPAHTPSTPPGRRGCVHRPSSGRRRRRAARRGRGSEQRRTDSRRSATRGRARAEGSGAGAALRWPGDGRLGDLGFVEADRTGLGRTRLRR